MNSVSEFAPVITAANNALKRDRTSQDMSRSTIIRR